MTTVHSLSGSFTDIASSIYSSKPIQHAIPESEQTEERKEDAKSTAIENELKQWIPLDIPNLDIPYYELPRSKTYSSSMIQSFMVKNLLASSVFGPKADLPFRYVFNSWQHCHDIYLRLETTEYRHVEIPYDNHTILKGMIFTAYDIKGLPKKCIDPNIPTVLVITGSYAPYQAYATGIIEGYRQLKAQVLAVNYIGFGDNAEIDEPTPENFIGSAEAALLWLIKREQIKPSKIIIHGYSLGVFPAADLACHYGTHVVFDRGALSVEDIAYAMLISQSNRIASAALAKIAMLNVPFTLKEQLAKIKGRIFVVQERNADDTAILPYLKKLQDENKLASSDIVTHVCSGGHFQTPFETWTVDGQKLGRQMGCNNNHKQEDFNPDDFRIRFSLINFINSIDKVNN